MQLAEMFLPWQNDDSGKYGEDDILAPLPKCVFTFQALTLWTIMFAYLLQKQA